MAINKIDGIVKMIDNTIAGQQNTQKIFYPDHTKIERKAEFKVDIHQGGSNKLNEIDEEIFGFIKDEEKRQKNGLELIASENFTSAAVMEAVGSCLTNKYSEGIPGRRYYGGNEVIDKIERLCQNRALTVFGLSKEKWHVNVQPYSGSVANLAAFLSVLNPNDRFMGLNLTDGGHLSHGFYRGHNAINISAKVFQSLPYSVDPKSGIIDYDELEKTAKRFCPKLIVAGSSAYPRDWNYKRFRSICDSVKAKLMVDMAHYSGLVASGLMNNPFQYADIVTTTTHKSLRGARGAMIFCRKELEKQVNSAVFPMVQGGPHNHIIAGIAVALKEAMSINFKLYSKQVILNCKRIAAILIKNGYKLATSGTDTHLLLWDVRPNGITGSKLEYVCDVCHITINKNTVHGDKSALVPGGVRIGTPALTTRGMVEDDMDVVTQFLMEACQIAIEIQKKTGKKMIKFKPGCVKNSKIQDLSKRVTEFSCKFPMPGIKLN